MRDATAEADFTRWARDRQGALLRTAVLLTGDRQRAEDLVQEALVVVASRWRSGSVEHPEAYARQVMVRRNVSWWRKHRREVLRDPGGEHAHPADPVDRTGRAEDRMVLDAALARLSRDEDGNVINGERVTVVGLSAGSLVVTEASGAKKRI